MQRIRRKLQKCKLFIVTEFSVFPNMYHRVSSRKFDDKTSYSISADDGLDEVINTIDMSGW